MAVATISRVGRSFGAKRVLHDFDLEVEPGERIGLHGPNGAGKSTLLRCVAGTLAPSSGRIEIGGDAAGTVAARARLGVCLAQGRGLYGRLTGEQNLALFARLRGVPHVHLVDELELQPLLPVRVDRCSAGMVGQLAFARALLGEPPLLLLDEPTRSLDDEARERMWAALERRASTAVLIATHRDDDLERCTRRIEIG